MYSVNPWLDRGTLYECDGTIIISNLQKERKNVFLICLVSSLFWLTGTIFISFSTSHSPFGVSPWQQRSHISCLFIPCPSTFNEILLYPFFLLRGQSDFAQHQPYCTNTSTKALVNSCRISSHRNKVLCILYIKQTWNHNNQ
ncbi:hypothetical protein BDV23DRAFT_158021 [Aspergillus alliaceus]|uniref:Uncharacterized protein n=1 Tax=Petromyces alliaceus TaxID=209559 RepID=A0A5N7C486_PETAA|nr:hypothetical protein BDV23DRAFT_158021 [Aspergillus alliaceus]